jgi:hypothetical protein
MDFQDEAALERVFTQPLLKIASAIHALAHAVNYAARVLDSDDYMGDEDREEELGRMRDRTARHTMGYEETGEPVAADPGTCRGCGHPEAKHVTTDIDGSGVPFGCTVVVGEFKGSPRCCDCPEYEGVPTLEVSQ